MTTQNRYNAAIRAAKAAGVTVRINVEAATRGSVTPAQIGVQDVNSDRYAFTWAGQGNRVRWVDGEAYSGERYARFMRQTRQRRYLRTPDKLAQYRATDVCWYHGGPGADAARVLADAFKTEGFEVDWDGTAYRAVIVKL